MLYHKHIPQFPLSRYIDCIVYVEGNNKGVGLPKTAMSLAFNLNDNFKLYTDPQFSRFIEYKKYWVAGLQTQPTYVESYGESKMLVIQFKTLGAYIFLNQPLRDFTNRYTDLDLICKNEADEVWEKLKASGSPQQKFMVAENFLQRYFFGHTLPHEPLIAAIDTALQQNTPVNDICLQYNVSRKHLNFLFTEYLGISPKTLSSLYRFQLILHTISRSRPGKLTTLAHELDFFDQSHFNNQFKKFTGLKPNDYIKNVETKPSLKIIPHFIPSG